MIGDQAPVQSGFEPSLENLSQDSEYPPAPLSSACAVVYERPLMRAVFLRRYKRFFADVEAPDGKILTVHCANSGSMRSCLEQGSPALIWDSANDSRKLRYTLEALFLEDGWACLNTMRANAVIAHLMANRKVLALDLAQLGEQALFPGARDFLEDFGNGTFQSEARFSAGTRFDGLHVAEGHRTWIEVKSVSLREGPQRVSFPDAVTARGSKHLNELSRAVAQGDSGVQLYVITRGTRFRHAELCQQFGLAQSIDAIYAERAEVARASGVRFGLLTLGISHRAVWVRGYTAW